MRILKYFLLFLIPMVFIGCAKEPTYDYSNFIASSPKSIVVLTPHNKSNEPKAVAGILANVIYPLSEAGYYVYPTSLVYDTFVKNGYEDGYEVQQIPYTKIREIFGADAALYIDIEEYGTKYLVISSSTIVDLNVKLVDLKTGKVLWDKRDKVIDEHGGASVGGLIVALTSQILSNVTDNAFTISQLASAKVFGTNCGNCILYGHRSPKYRQDSELKK